MTARSTATAKAVLCLAVAAAGDPTVTAAAFYALLRVLGTYWAGREIRPATTTTVSLGGRVRRWVWRFEVAAALVVAAFRSVLSAIFGAGTATLLLGVAVGLILGVPVLRAALRDHLVRLRRRRSWQACLGAVFPAPTTPVVTAVGVGAQGEWVTVRIGTGSTAADLLSRSEAIAACLAVSTVRVERHPDNAGWATIHAMAVDPLLWPAPPWPWLYRGQTWAWEPIPVGVDETGRQVSVSLAEHNLLLGGEPGAGKSVALSQLVAAAVCDPSCGLWLLDGKLVELAPWRPAADGWAGVDVTEAVAVLRQVQKIMDDRYRMLLAAGKRKITSDTALQVVVVDELAHYLTGPDKKLCGLFAETLRDLVSRGRAAGVVVIAATQKPSSDVIPTSLRDLFGYRWALRCTTNAASDTILGSGWASQGVTSATVAANARGVGWLLHESGTPIRLRAHHLDDNAIAEIAGRASWIRSWSKSTGQDD